MSLKYKTGKKEVPKWHLRSLQPLQVLACGPLQSSVLSTQSTVQSFYGSNWSVLANPLKDLPSTLNFIIKNLCIDP